MILMAQAKYLLNLPGVLGQDHDQRYGAICRQAIALIGFEIFLFG
jgi:hypothetical protein